MHRRAGFVSRRPFSRTASFTYDIYEEGSVRKVQEFPLGHRIRRVQPTQ